MCSKSITRRAAIIVVLSSYITTLDTRLFAQVPKLDQLKACAVTKLSQLVVAQRKPFSSQLMSENCPSPSGVVNCISERDATHQYALTGGNYLIEAQSVKFAMSVSANGGAFHDIATTADRLNSTVRLTCRVDQCGGAGASIGDLVGFLEYQPTPDDRRREVAACLKEIDGVP